ncbi:pirin family protein [Aurantivibrio plasticivorans]
MSIESGNESNCLEQSGKCDTVELSILPKERDLGGFSVRRVLPAAKRKMIGPWIFFDHMGPANFPPGEGIDVRPHPHINLATVTYLFEGEMFHRDSLGNALAICPGDINLMIAGKGIVHSERQRDEVKRANHHIEGLQLWLALPESDEEMEPEFHHYNASDLPETTVDGVPVKVLIGSAYGVTSPVKAFAETLYVEANLKQGQSLSLPESTEQRGLYIVDGRLNTNGNELEAYSMTIFHPGKVATVTAEIDTKLVIIGGEPLPLRHLWWNFVSSRQERIESAKNNWKNGRFPKVPGDEIEFIPLPED